MSTRENRHPHLTDDLFFTNNYFIHFFYNQIRFIQKMLLSCWDGKTEFYTQITVHYNTKKFF